MENLLSTKELSEYLNISEKTLIQYRLKGIGPRYVKIGHLVRYRKVDADQWVVRNLVVIP